MEHTKKQIKDLGENEVIKCVAEQEVLELCKTLPYTNVRPLGVLKANRVVYLGTDSWYSHTGPNTIILTASSFLPDEFYPVEPKVGQKLECIDGEMDYLGIGNDAFIVGNKYEISEANKTEDGFAIYINTWLFVIDKDKNDIAKHFKFHSNPSDMYPTEETTLNTSEHECKYCGAMTTQPDEQCYKAPEISERKRESFRFYDMLPPELARQAKENFDEGRSELIPTCLKDSIWHGWNWSSCKHGNDDSWASVYNNASQGKYNLSEAHSSVIIDPAKYEYQSILIDVYSKLDDNGKKVMRENYPNVEFPKVKRYWNTIHAPFTYSHGILTCLDDVTPEIEGNEIRFVKN